RAVYLVDALSAGSGRASASAGVVTRDCVRIAARRRMDRERLSAPAARSLPPVGSETAPSLRRRLWQADGTFRPESPDSRRVGGSLRFPYRVCDCCDNLLRNARLSRQVPLLTSARRASPFG